MSILRFYRTSELNADLERQVADKSSQRLGRSIPNVKIETCFYARVDSAFSDHEVLWWLLGETFEPNQFGDSSFVSNWPTVLEVGPRLNHETPWSSRAVAICRDCGLQGVLRLERSFRYALPIVLSEREEDLFLAPLYDRMTHDRYLEPLTSFDTGGEPEPVRIIPLLEEGLTFLQAINKTMGLGMDDQDLAWCHALFRDILKRNPTDVELFQLGQANSEHSRHGFFKGLYKLGQQLLQESLLDIVKAPLKAIPDGGNSLSAFSDDSSAIKALRAVPFMVRERPDQPSRYIETEMLVAPTLSVETHNHPSGIEPYEGAATGIGGDLRDLMAFGRGSRMVATGFGLVTGHLHISGYELPWEQDGWHHPSDLASPLEIRSRGRRGAFDYGNCIGIPTIVGYDRTIGIEAGPGDYRTNYKPVLFCAGFGQGDQSQGKRLEATKGMLVFKIGGLSYRVGVGGGSASSMEKGENETELDFKSVQRGDPEMERRVGNVIHACFELGKANPIAHLVDPGAGGLCNSVTEAISPTGALIKLRSIPVGDTTLNSLERWGSESQEQMVILVKPGDSHILGFLCEREQCPWIILGEVTGDGNIVLYDEVDDSSPVSLPLAQILEDLPRKVWNWIDIPRDLKPLSFPADLNVRDALERVLRHITVACKSHHTRTVDRSVGGKIAQQQCVGPHQLPLADCGIVVTSASDTLGTAYAIGEQPFNGLISDEALGRMGVSESLLNMMGACIGDIKDIRFSANWMAAGKLPGEGIRIYRAAKAMATLMIELGMAIDGGKDSMSMASDAINPQGEVVKVKSPIHLVLTGYAPVPDIAKKALPVCDSGDRLIYISLSPGKYRLGGSILGQVYGQLGDECPDLDDPDLLLRAFTTIQSLIDLGEISSYHDISDGGLIVTLLEMAFASNLGLTAGFWNSSIDPLTLLFAEEPGMVIGCKPYYLSFVTEDLGRAGVPHMLLGEMGGDDIAISHNGDVIINEPMPSLRSIWNETSWRLAAEGGNLLAKEEAQAMASLRSNPSYRFPKRSVARVASRYKPKAAVFRAAGSNGESEMAHALALAGFDAWDIHLSDLLQGRISLDLFHFLAIVGGFSYGDTLDAGKGWAGVIRFRLKEHFDRFFAREDTLSFGVCNGAQVGPFLGQVPFTGLDEVDIPRFVRNRSNVFESIFSMVEILPSPAVMFAGMEGSRLGIWSSHGEGRLHIVAHVLESVLAGGLAPIRYTDYDGQVTEQYPFNPNGSPLGIAGLCDSSGRHVLHMPHSERTYLPYQWPWLPPEMRDMEMSPWLIPFINAHNWCVEMMASKLAA